MQPCVTLPPFKLIIHANPPLEDYTPKGVPIGTQVTVIGVDDIGSIMVKWDNGSTLSVVYGADHCKLI